MSAARNLPVPRARRLATPALLLTAALLGASGSQAQVPVQATFYIPNDWCQGGYCGSSPSVAFQASIEQALLDTHSIQVVRTPPNFALQLSGGITSITNGGSLCLPIIGCLSGKTVHANIELMDTTNGAVLWRDACEGTSGGITTWGWAGYIQVNSDDDKAAADCAGKLVQKFLTSPTYLSYLQGLQKPPQPPQGNAPQPPGGPAPTPQQPAPAPLPAAGWLYGIIFLDEPTRTKACKEGYDAAAAGANTAAPGHAIMTSPEGTVTIDTSYGNTFLKCQKVGQNALAMPDSVPQEDSIIISKTGDINNSALATAIEFDDATGNSLGRINIFTVEKKNEYCAYDACVVKLTPSNLDATTKALIYRADSMKLLINLGKGIESFTISKSRFPDLK